MPSAHLRKRQLRLTVAVIAALLLLAFVGNLVEGVRFYVPSAADEPLGWAWRACAVLLVATLIALGWSAAGPWSRRAGRPARAAGVSLAAAPASYVLMALAWADDATPLELAAMQLFFYAAALSLVVGIACWAAAARRGRSVASSPASVP